MNYVLIADFGQIALKVAISIQIGSYEFCQVKTQLFFYSLQLLIMGENNERCYPRLSHANELPELVFIKKYRAVLFFFHTDF